MKKFLKLGVMMLLVATILTILLAGAAFAVEDAGPMGPAPSSGDGDPDGSGLESPNVPIGEIGSGSGPVGPAPSSGDGESEGSGF